MTFAWSFAPPPGASSSDPGVGTTVSGHGTTNVNAFAMVAYADVTGIGPVTSFMNGSSIWEFGGVNYRTSPGLPVTAPGASIAGFAASVEYTLGPEAGSVAMLRFGSATGYLDLVQQAITTATTTGTGTINGVPVTYYKVSVDPAKLATAPGLTPEVAAAVDDALRLLNRDGFRQMTDTVAVDHQGRIRSVTEVVTFADGGVVTQRSILSNFGCAATVVRPGAQAPSTTLAPCQSGTP
jgi:hypothetical protein